MYLIIEESGSGIEIKCDYFNSLLTIQSSWRQPLFLYGSYHIEMTILHTTISSSPCLSLVSLVLLTQGVGTGFITVCYILSWVGLFQQFAGPPRLMQSVGTGTSKGKAESGSCLLDWPGSMGRKAKSSRR